MNDTHDVNYTFYDHPKFLSPKPQNNIDKLGGIDKSAIETIEPSSKLLDNMANKLTPKKFKRSIFDLPVYGKRRRSRNLKRKKKSKKNKKNLTRRRSRKRSKI